MRNLNKELQEVIGQLYSQNYNNMISYALAVLNSVSLSEDAVHETFYEAIRKYDTIKDHPNLIGWLYVTLKRKIQEIQRRQTQNFRLVSIESEEEAIDYTASDLDKQILMKGVSVERIKSVLTPDEFYLFERISLDEARVEKVAKELGITPDACYKRHSRLKKKLRALFSDIID